MWQDLPASPSSLTCEASNEGEARLSHFGSSRLLTVTGVAALTLLLALHIATPSDGSLSRQMADRYVTLPVVRGDLAVKVTATGTVEPTSLVEVSTTLSGTVKAVHVKNNERIRVGQLLAELDTSTARLEQRRAEAAVKSAEAKIKEFEAQTTLARRDLSRKQRLAGNRFSTERDLDLAVSNLHQSEAKLEAMLADLALAKVGLEIKASDLSKAGITSPIDGIVLRRNIEPGQTIAASFAAPVLFRLAPGLEKMQLRVDVDEADAMLVRAGSRATFQVHALRDQRLAARVETVYLGPEIVQGVVTYKAILSFDNRQLQLRPGMTASAEIEVAAAHNATLIPNAALRFSSSQQREASGPRGHDTPALAPDAVHAPADTRRRVLVVRHGVAVPVEIEIGDTDGSKTVVRSGAIEAGDAVVVEEIDPKERSAGE